MTILKNLNNSKFIIVNSKIQKRVLKIFIQEI